MASTDVAVAREFAQPGVLGFLRREGLVVAVVCAYAASLAYQLPLRVAQDAWLALVAGRQVVDHGIPRTDTLTYWTAGKHWIDVQWLSQAAEYGLYRLGGVKLFAITHVLLVVVALGLVVALARRRGASPRAIAWLSLPAGYLLTLVAGHVRTQGFAYVLFAVVLLFLMEDAWRPSRRVLLVVPILALWSNIHGSVVLGVAMVAVYGALAVRRRSTRVTGALLLIGGLLALIATPWFIDTLGYYRSTLFNSEFRDVITEWARPTLSLALLPFFLLAGAALWLLGRCPRRFTAFDRLLLLLLLALSLSAQRNIVWLVLAAIPLLAPALDDVLPRASQPTRAHVNAAVGLFGCAAACLVLAGAALRSENSYMSLWPTAAGAEIARLAKQDPTARFYVDQQYADWLLMTEPQLAGRIAYDIRFELLSSRQLTAVARWSGEIGTDWKQAAGGARFIVLALPNQRPNELALAAEPGTTIAYRDARIAILQRRRPGRDSLN